MRVRVLLLACSVLLSGCLVSTEGPGGQAVPLAAPSWRTDCALAGAATLEETGCVVFFDGGDGANLEPSVATHPTDPRTVLLAWTARGESVQVWTALTRDGGATWTTTAMRDPSLPPLPGLRLSWDQTAAFLPDGTAAVLYAGESQMGEHAKGVADPLARITLALSRDGGATWEYRRVAEDPAALAWDYPHLAVAPDTGDLHVTAYTAGLLGNGVWLWTSRDEGLTWERRMLHELPPVLAHTRPRVAAGPGGFVAVATESSLLGFRQQEPGAYAAVSFDGGGRFEPTQRIGPQGEIRGAPAFWTGPDGGPRVDVAVSAPAAPQLVRSPDGGRAWDAPREAAALPGGMRVAWAVPAASASGDLAVLTMHESTSPLRWGLLLTHERPEGARETMTLAPTLDGHPRPPSTGVFGEGNEYGGLAFAQDGSLWAAWADTRGGETTQIALARLVPG